MDYPQADNEGSTPLHLAAHFGYKSVAKMLLERGADPRKENDDGETPLSLARDYGHREVVVLLRGLRPRRRRDVP